MIVFKKTHWLLILVAIAGCGDTATYYKCPSCGAAYKQKWYQTGLPGQRAYKCGDCNAKLRECSKDDSGWNDDREPTIRGK